MSNRVEPQLDGTFSQRVGTLKHGVNGRDLGRHPEAAEKFRRVLELEPANVDAHYELGCIALAAQRYEQAHLEFELVLKLDPQFPGIHMAVGEALESARTEREPEFVALDLRAACDALGEITGAITSDDILDRIFSEFCIGK